jgi:hypothetical protein
MTEHGTPATSQADSPAFTLPPSLAALTFPLCAGGLVALVIGWAVGSFGVSVKFGMSAYLTAFMYCLTVTLGCLFFVLIQHLVRAGWSAVVRRIAELVMVMIFPLGLLFLPVVGTLIMGEGALYSWDKPSYAVDNHIPEEVWTEKSRWLNQNWFTLRAIVYFAIWGGLAMYFFRGSVDQDETGDRAITDRLQFWSGPGVVLFCVATSLAAFDWIMSLSPMWFSTMFGVYMFTGAVLSAHCLIAVLSYTLKKQGAMRDEVTVEHYHDLCKFMFGFLLFWAYIGFCQFMLIWYGNIPEETHWFYARLGGAFGVMSLMLIFLHWGLPFLGTMPMKVRRTPKLVVGWGVYILVLHFVDVYWMIMPEARAAVPGAEPATMGGIPGILASLLCVGGMAALLLGLVLRVAGQTKVVAAQDPRLADSIAFENI